MKIQPSHSWLEDRHRHPPRKDKKVKGSDFEKHLKEAMGIALYDKFRIGSNKEKKK